MLLLISGLPASGKSYFGRWLETEQNFVHIDPEQDDRLSQFGLDLPWQQCVGQKVCGPFVSSLLHIGRSIVFNWGFPVRCLPVVAQLKSAGFACWWFEADPVQAERAFQARGKGQLATFQIQIAGIASARPEIKAVFGSNSIVTLNRRGSRLKPETIWSRIEAAA